METILQAVFNREADARQGRRALEVLADNDTVWLGETFLLSRNRAGDSPAIQSAWGEDLGSRTLGGGLVGGLVRLLGGPVGVVRAGNLFWPNGRRPR